MRLNLSATTRNRPYMAQASDMVTIVEGTPYVVPVGRIFVLLGLGQADILDATIPTLAILRADNVIEHTGGLYGCSMQTAQASTGFYAGVSTGVPVVPCVSFAAGVSLDVSGGAGGADCRAWGYTAAA